MAGSKSNETVVSPKIEKTVRVNVNMNDGSPEVVVNRVH